MQQIPRIASVMTPFPYSAQASDSVLQARRLMVDHGVRHLPVKRGQALVGILTDRDLKRALDPELGLPPKDELFVEDVYLPDPCVVDGGTPLDEVLETMARRHIGSVLVTSHERLSGIFTATDACRLYCQHLRALFPSSKGTDAA